MESIINKPGIYRIIHLSGAMYVGSTHDLSSRLRYHRRELLRGGHHNRLLQAAWDQSHPWEWIWEFARSSSKDFELREEERALLDSVPDGYLFNICRVAGSSRYSPATAETREKRRRGVLAAHARRRAEGRPFKHSEKTKELIRQQKLGLTYGPETREKVGKFWRGRKRTEQNKQKLSAAHRALWDARREAGVKVVQTTATKEKKRLALLGRPRDQNVREKIREGMRRVWKQRLEK